MPLIAQFGLYAPSAHPRTSRHSLSSVSVPVKSQGNPFLSNSILGWKTTSTPWLWPQSIRAFRKVSFEICRRLFHLCICVKTVSVKVSSNAGMQRKHQWL